MFFQRISDIKPHLNTFRTPSILRAYAVWGSNLRYGSAYITSYGDVIDFVNFRMERVTSRLALIEQDKIGDALGVPLEDLVK
jgi:hypothetical protein